MRSSERFKASTASKGLKISDMLFVVVFSCFMENFFIALVL